MKEVAQILRKKGLKVTPQRIAIYTMLSNTKEHPSAETIYKSLEIENPAMSLATVYKTLDSFENSNLVRVLNVGDGCSRYDASINCHPHIVCKDCYSVADLVLNSVEIQTLRKSISEQSGFVIESEQFFFYGKCEECQKKAFSGSLKIV